MHPDELLAAVAGALAIQRSRNASAEEPEGLSDSLTGLGNRRLGERELDLFVARSTRHGHALAVVMAAIDGYAEARRRATATPCSTRPARGSRARCAAAT